MSRDRIPIYVRCGVCREVVATRNARRWVGTWARIDGGGTFSGTAEVTPYNDVTICDRCLLERLAGAQLTITIPGPPANVARTKPVDERRILTANEHKAALRNLQQQLDEEKRRHTAALVENSRLQCEIDRLNRTYERSA